MAGLSTHLSQPSHNIWASLAWDNLCFHKFQVGEMVYIYKNLKGSYFYHFQTLKTFKPFSTSKRRSSVSSQKWRQRLKKWCLGLHGTGHCKNPATYLLPSSCLLPCTVMPWPNWGKQAAAAQVARGSDTGWWFSIIFWWLHDGGSRPRDHRDLISRHQH